MVGPRRPKRPALRGLCLRREAGADEVQRALRNGRGGDGAAAGAGVHAGAFDNLGEQGGEIEASADAQDRRDQGGIAVAPAFGLRCRLVEVLQRSFLPRPKPCARQGDSPLAARAEVY